MNMTFFFQGEIQIICISRGKGSSLHRTVLSIGMSTVVTQVVTVLRGPALARRWPWFTAGRGAALLYLLGSLAYVPGAFLLHPAFSKDREHEAVALYIFGSAAMTLAAALDYNSRSSSASALQRGLGYQLLGTIDSVHLCAGGGVCFLAGSIAIWPGNGPNGTVVGRWSFRIGNLAYILGSFTSWRAANSRLPPLGASLYALSGFVFLAGGLFVHELGPGLTEEGMSCWVVAALLLVAAAFVGVRAQFMEGRTGFADGGAGTSEGQDDANVGGGGGRAADVIFPTADTVDLAGQVLTMRSSSLL